MDADGEVLTSSVPRNVKGFEQVASKLADLKELMKAEKEGKLEGDAAAKLLLARLELGQVKLAEAKERRAAITGPVAAEVDKQLTAALVDLEVAETVAKHQSASMAKRNEITRSLRVAQGQQLTPEQRSEMTAKMTEVTNETMDAVAADFRAMLEAGRIPSDKQALTFWMQLHNSAQRGDDAEMVQRARKELEALAERNPAQRAMVERVLNPGAARGRVVPATPIRAAPPTEGGAKKEAEKSGKKNDAV